MAGEKDKGENRSIIRRGPAMSEGKRIKPDMDISRENRNIGIDLLRILSMLMVVVLHLLGQGGILSDDLTVYNKTAYWLEVCSYCAVNIFAIISGYVGVKSEWKVKRIFNIELQCIFYSVIIYVLGMFLFDDIGIMMVVKQGFFPIKSRTWWYATAYAGIFFLLPYLNFFTQNEENKKVLCVSVVALTVMFVIFPLVFMHGDPFGLNGGYGVVWLLYLYLIGAFIRVSKLAQRFKPIVWLALYFVSSLTVWIQVIYFPWLKDETWGWLFLRYNSLPVFMAAVSLVCFFAELKIKKKIFLYIIEKFSGGAFAVYLIHTHPVVWDHLLVKTKEFVSLRTSVMVLDIILGALLVYMTCFGIEQIRKLLFRISGLNSMYDKILKKCEAFRSNRK